MAGGMSGRDERAKQRVANRKTSGWLKGVWSRLAASDSELAAGELRDDVERAGCTCLSDVPDRARARVRGVLKTVTMQPRHGLPALEAELFDGTDTVTLIWVGRRRIIGVDCGRPMVAEGRVSMLEGRRVMFNPAYELQAEGVNERI